MSKKQRLIEHRQVPGVGCDHAGSEGSFTVYRMVEVSPDGTRRVLLQSTDPLTPDSCPECGSDERIL
jgi:hypothetical protein